MEDDNFDVEGKTSRLLKSDGNKERFSSQQSFEKLEMWDRRGNWSLYGKRGKFIIKLMLTIAMTCWLNKKIMAIR